MFLVSISITSMFTTISSHNYPGGNVLNHFVNEIIPKQQLLSNNYIQTVHIDVFPAQTGITR